MLVLLCEGLKQRSRLSSILEVKHLNGMRLLLITAALEGQTWQLHFQKQSYFFRMFLLVSR